MIIIGVRVHRPLELLSVARTEVLRYTRVKPWDKRRGGAGKLQVPRLAPLARNDTPGLVYKRLWLKLATAKQSIWPEAESRGPMAAPVAGKMSHKAVISYVPDQS